MKAFGRIFAYIWPQWPRVIVVVLSAMVVAILLSLSFMTIIPLLKVMMGKEGLHGWVDRKSCEWKYGLDSYVPNTADFTGKDSQDVPYYLLVTAVSENGLGKSAGVRTDDRIIGAGDLLVGEEAERIPFLRILAGLATTRQEKILLQLKRPGKNGTSEDVTLELNTPENKAYIEHMPWSRIERVEFAFKQTASRWVQKAVGLLPREESLDTRTKAIVMIILLMGLFTVIRCFAKFYQVYLAQKVMQVGVNHIREDAFGRALDIPMGFFVNERPSDTVSRIVRDTAVLGGAIKVLLGKALREPLNALFMLAGAMLLDWQLTLIFMCAAPLVLWLLSLFGKKMKRATRKSLVVSSQMLAKLQESMAGLRVVKVYNRQAYERQTFKELNHRLLRQLLKISKVNAATMPVLEVLSMVAGSAALIIGVQWVTASQMDSSVFLVLLILLGAAGESVRKTSDIWNRIQEANAAAERVFAVIDEPIERERSGAVELGGLRRSIEFRGIVFTYPGSPTPALKGINLTVQAGHNIAVVGPNGSGKTTLANLIPRFYDPDSGRILIDGIDIRDATLVSLRNQIGMVTQDMVTFNDTIAANIGYGKAGASTEEIIRAAKLAFAHEFIEPLPNGYETVIGEQGTGLSGGQLQRIVIARAILKNPAILIFDEATSQVDADSEAKIHKAIEEIMQDRTSFVIAHRFSTVIAADVIVVMEDGRIIAEGQHEELVHSCSLYRSLYETQVVIT